MAKQLLVGPGAVSLHEQVRRDLLQRIRSNEFAIGDMLPSEEALCNYYGVSRITIRRAVTELAADFYVTRKRGVGTIVNGRPDDRRIFRLTGYFAEGQLDSRVLMEEVIPADEQVAGALNVEIGTLVNHTRSFTHRHSEPYTLVEAYIVAASGDQNLPNWQQVERAEQLLEAVGASALVAEHLGLKEGQPIMQSRRVFYSPDNKPVRFTVSCYHPDHYRFIADLRPRRDQAPL